MPDRSQSRPAVTDSFRLRLTPKRGRIAFTLIELLVVIAIVAVLSSLLLGGLAKAKATSKSAVCKSNLRQIGVALKIYVDDYGKYPGIVMFENGAGFDLGLTANGITSSVPADLRIVSGPDFEKLFLCPVARSNKAPQQSQTDYGYNVKGTGWILGNVSDLGLGPRFTGTLAVPTIGFAFIKETKDSDVAAPQDMIAFADNRDSDDFTITPQSPYSPNESGFGTRHRGGSNIVFCDGHIEYGTATQVAKATEAARSRWNNDNLPHPETW